MENNAENFNPKQLSHEDQIRLGYIEGREDLFETRLLRIEPAEAGGAPAEAKKILIATRDTGSGNALTPVMELLRHDSNIQMDILTDGRAQEIMQKKFKTSDITPSGMVLGSDRSIGRVNAILTNSSPSNIGLEAYAAGTFNESPSVVVEDYYTSSFNYLEALIERKLPLPEKICVMDEAARALVAEKFPELGGRITVTGQPAFDRFAHEPTEEIMSHVRKKLGLTPQDKLVTFMATFTPDFPCNEGGIQKLARQFAATGPDTALAFRIHPRDNTPYASYETAFKALGIKTIDTRTLSTDEVSAASDMIITTWSTEGLHGIYRRKPTIHLIDASLNRIPETLTLPIPPVKLGASVGIDNVQKLSDSINLLKGPSETLAQLEMNMKKYYPLDGKNTQRVADEVRGVMSAGKK